SRPVSCAATDRSPVELFLQNNRTICVGRGGSQSHPGPPENEFSGYGLRSNLQLSPGGDSRRCAPVRLRRRQAGLVGFNRRLWVARKFMSGQCLSPLRSPINALTLNQPRIMRSLMLLVACIPSDKGLVYTPRH